MRHNLNRYKQASASLKFDFIVCSNSIRSAENHSPNIYAIWNGFVQANSSTETTKFTILIKFEPLPFNLSILQNVCAQKLLFQWI